MIGGGSLPPPALTRQDQLVARRSIDLPQALVRQRPAWPVENDPAILERDGAPAEIPRILDLMQRHDDGDPVLVIDPLERFHHPSCRAWIERGDRLVRQDDRRLLHQRPGDRRPLLLAAGKRRRTPPRRLGNAHAGERAHRLVLLCRAEPAQCAAPARRSSEPAGQHIGQHRQSSDQIELLEHHADLAARRPHRPQAARPPGSARLSP